MVEKPAIIGGIEGSNSDLCLFVPKQLDLHSHESRAEGHFPDITRRL